jgi:hypothetical protein
MKAIIDFFKKLFGVKPQAIVKPINKAKNATAEIGHPDPLHPGK